MKSFTLLCGLWALASATPSDDTVTVCKYLLAKYPQYLAFDPLGSNAALTASNASTYNEINNHYWNAENSDFYRSACAFFPATAEQVSDAVKQLNQYPSVPYGLKSGGHNPAPGFSATKDGVLISFAPNLASTVRSADGKHFVVGMGARWGQVYNVTQRTNQAVVGGRLADIGVGGFVLGGGLSYLSAQYGLACDNIDSWEAVLANGTIVHASRNHHRDLWFALRGGGNQYAIVTRVTTQAHPIGINGMIWGGTRGYTIDKRDAVHRAIADFTANNRDTKAAVIPTFEFGGPANALDIVSGIIVFFFYDGPTPPAGVFDKFEAITNSTDDTKTQTYYSLSTEIGGADLTGFGNSFRASTFPNYPTPQMAQFLGKLWNTTNAKALDDSLTNLDVQLLGYDPQPLPVLIAHASQAQGGNVLGLDPEHGDRIWIEHNLLWTNQLCNEKCPSFAKDITNTMTAYAEATFAGVPPTKYKCGNLTEVSYNPVFMNDAAPDQAIYDSYPAKNLKKLRVVKKAYDPTGFFTTRQGGFKLPTK